MPGQRTLLVAAVLALVLARGGSPVMGQEVGSDPNPPGGAAPVKTDNATTPRVATLIESVPGESTPTSGPLGSLFLERQVSYYDNPDATESEAQAGDEPALLDGAPTLEQPAMAGALGSLFLEQQAQFMNVQNPPESGGLPGARSGGGQSQPPQTSPGFRFGKGGSNYGAPESGGLPGYRRRPGPGSGFGTIALPEMPAPRTYKPNQPPPKRKLEAEFGDGLEVKSEDGYFTLVFHNLSQADYRGFNPKGDPLNSGFIIPRQRWYVVGNVSEYVRYYTVINRGYGSLDLLDSFVDLNFGHVDREKFQLRVGRMKTPYTYEYIKISETDLIAAERSVFVGNFSTNRQTGAMAHGDLLEKRFEYALGVFNGPRRSFQDYGSSPNLFTFVNLKPFLKGDVELLQQLNFTGSFNIGYEHSPLQPAALTTANDQSPSATVQNVSPTFLTFNSGVFENGQRAQWGGDIAYYYKSFGLLAGYQGGYADYGISPTAIPANFVNVNSPTRTRVPLSGYSVAMYYFVTGEEITRRVELLQPRRPYAPGGGGPGAIELFTRFANCELGNNVFTSGLVNPAEWSNRANVTDTGVNWYLHHYIKLTFDWQYSDFGKPVYLAPHKMTRFENLFWLRTQVYF